MLRPLFSTLAGGRPVFAGRCPAGTSPSVVGAPGKGGSPQVARAVEKARTSATAAVWWPRGPPGRTPTKRPTCGD